MATTISAGTNPYKLGSPPDFGVLYSGRAIEFDGVADYVSSGTSPLLEGYTAMTVSLWFKPSAVNVSGTLVSKLQNDSTNRPLYIYHTNATINFGINDAQNQVTGNVLVADQWCHIVCVYVGGTSITVYINGEQSAQNTSSIDASLEADGASEFGLGAQKIDATPEHFATGKITNVQLWDKAWSLSDVQYAYTHPEKLITHNSSVTSGTTISNLKAWYPMAEGSPRSPQTSILDGSPKELGSDLVTDGDMELAGTDNWDDKTGVTVSKDTSVFYAGSQSLKVETDGSTTYEGAEQTISATVSGAIYKVTGYYKTDNIVRIYCGNSINYETLPVVSEWTAFTVYVPQIAGSGTRLILMHQVASKTSNWDNVVVKEVKMGNHGTTTFTEVIKEDDASANNIAGNWTTTGTSATLSFSTDRYEHGNEGVGSYVYSEFSGTAGSSYLVEFKVLNKDVGSDFDVTPVIYNGTTYKEGTAVTISALETTTYTSLSETIVTDATSATSRWGFKVTDDLGRKKFKLKDLKITEVGVASGWTTADAEPLIPQTALMGYSKPMVFDGIDDYLTKAVANYRASDSSGTISAWVKCPSSLTGGTIFGTSDTGTDDYYLDFGMYQGELNMWEKNDDSESQVKSTTSINDDKLHHCVLTADGSAYKLYIDGHLETLATSTENDGNWLNVTGDAERDNITIGVLTRTGVGNYWDGEIFEVSLWNDDLSLAEVQELFNDGVALDATTHSASSELVGYWKNDGASTWTDLEGSDDLTSSGSPDTILIPEGTTAGKDLLGFPLTHPNHGWLNLSGSEYVDLGQSINLGELSTISLWLKRDNPTVDITVPLGEDDNSSDYFLYLNRHLQLYVRIGVPYYLFDATALTTAINTTDWMHITVLREGASCKIYINAVLKETMTSMHDSSDTLELDTTIDRIGQGSGGGSGHVGMIDEVMFFNKALSEDEIEDNYLAGVNKHKN
jgi:hypothetical protein